MPPQPMLSAFIGEHASLNRVAGSVEQNCPSASNYSWGIATGKPDRKSVSTESICGYSPNETTSADIKDISRVASKSLAFGLKFTTAVPYFESHLSFSNTAHRCNNLSSGLGDSKATHQHRECERSIKFHGVFLYRMDPINGSMVLEAIDFR